MKILDEIVGDVERLSTEGKGIITKQNKSISIPFSYPGDEITAKLMKRTKGMLSGVRTAILKPSPDRITPRCPHAESCGGCPLQALSYDAQKKWKRQFVTDAFLPLGLKTEIPEPISSPSLFYHRNRMDYVIGVGTDGKAQIGLKAPGAWWKILPLTTCFMLSEDAVSAMHATETWLHKHSIAGWNAESHEGYARYLVIREGKNTGERMIILVTHTGDLPHKDELIEVLSPFCTTLYHAINATITDVSVGSEYHLLYGKSELTETVRGKTYLIPPTAFFQTNTEGAGVLADVVSEMIGTDKPKTLLDLYCGTGFFSVQLADRAQRILGIEIDPAAIETAKRNATTNNITNVEFRSEKVEQLSWNDEKPNLVLLDPPRAGLHPKVIELLMTQLPPRIIYVSCSYTVLARELPKFLDKYTLKNIKLVDLFPHSPHVETVVELVRK